MGEFFKFSKIAATGTRVPRNTHAPLTLPGVLSTAGHCDQSIVDAIAKLLLSFQRKGYTAPVTNFNPRPHSGQTCLVLPTSLHLQSARESEIRKRFASTRPWV